MGIRRIQVQREADMPSNVAATPGILFFFRIFFSSVTELQFSKNRIIFFKSQNLTF